MVWHETIGRGPVKVLLIHGWFWDHHVFRPMYNAVDEDLYTYAFFDFRGYGRSRSLSGDYSVSEIARDATSVAAELRWAEFHVVGHSMGGKVAQKIAMDLNSKVRSVVALTPVPACALPFDGATYEYFLSAAENDSAAMSIIRQSVGEKIPEVWLRRLVERTRATSKKSAFRSYAKSFIKDDFSNAAAQLKVPLLVLYGENDSGISGGMVKSIYPSLYPHAELEMLPGCGHYPMQETPLSLVGVLERFLAKHS